MVILFLLKYLWISAVSICDCLFVCLLIHLFICVSVACLPLYGSVRLLVSVCLSVRPSFCVSVRPTVCPSVRLPVCVFVCLWCNLSCGLEIPWHVWILDLNRVAVSARPTAQVKKQSRTISGQWESVCIHLVLLLM